MIVYAGTESYYKVFMYTYTEIKKMFSLMRLLLLPRKVYINFIIYSLLYWKKVKIHKTN